MNVFKIPGKKVHFLGIGGIGVSALARFCATQGLIVSGSDVRESSVTRALETEGVTVYIGHMASNLQGVDLVVHSTAIPRDNPEMLEAQKQGIPLLHRSELLASLVASRKTVGVTGTNGKGTVSAMIASIFEAAGREPSFYIGAHCLNFGTNARVSQSPWLIAELDESDGSLCNTTPSIALLNNLEADHLNYYRDFDHVVDTLRCFYNGLSEGALGVFNADDQGSMKVASTYLGPKISFGTSPDATYRVDNIQLEPGGSNFILHHPNGSQEIRLSVPGGYNVENAAGAAAVSIATGVSPLIVARGLADFMGLANRYTVISRGDVRLIKDYMSHPTGIRKVLQTARLDGASRLRAVFKPYRYTMINYHAQNYALAFQDADEVIVTEMWEANEEPIPGVTTPWLTEVIARHNGSACYIKDMEDILPYLRRTIKAGESIVFFGGDDLFELAETFAAEVRSPD